MIDDLLNQYNNELSALRRLTGAFARAHPKVAGRLRLSEDAVEDPHVSRLLEGVALLNARIREKLKDEFPELTDALLEHLYPHYLAPVPSMTIVELACQKDLSKPVTIAARTEIETEPVDNEVCRFSTSQAVTLMPLSIDDGTLLARPFVAPVSRESAGAVAVLRLQLRCRQADQTFAKLGVDTLRFFLRGPAAATYPLYELICNNAIVLAIAESPKDADAVFLGPENLRAVGFDRDDGVLPTTARAAVGYRLLTEFFAFPERFLFFELSGLRARTARLGSTLQIYVYLNRSRPELEKLVAKDSFALNCVPMVNLFRHQAEPIRLNQTQTEYKIVPDVRRRQALEVYSVDAVTAASPDGEIVKYRPFYALSHSGAAPDAAQFWHVVRRPAEGRGSAFDSYLTLVDLNLNPRLPANWVVSVETTCTNRDLPARLPFGGGRPALRLAKPLASVAGVTALTVPTGSLRLPNREQGRWRLVSHLLLNHLSITGGEAGADSLKEMLRLYDYRDSADSRAVIDAIQTIRSEQRTARVVGQRGALCRGLDIVMTLDETAGSESGIYLLAAILERVFSLQVTINSFTRLSVCARGKPGYLYQWPARAGDRILL